MKVLRIAAILFALLYLAPLAAGAALSYGKGWPESWRAADWSSTGTAPDPAAHPDAILRVYAARAGAWKGIFSVHTWIAYKPEGASGYTRYDVMGWGMPVRRNSRPVDARWYGNEPDLVYELRGARAAALIPRVEAAVSAYPYNLHGGYRIWPGPNSNSFVAAIARAVPGFDPVLPATALGKDFLGTDVFLAGTPSNTGWQVSLYGLAGLTLARAEGFEISLFGLVFALNPARYSLSLPSLGTFSPVPAGRSG